MNLDDEASSIREVVNGQWPIENAVYDLNGRKVYSQTSNLKSQISNLKKGLYIKNGRKYIVK